MAEYCLLYYLSRGMKDFFSLKSKGCARLIPSYPNQLDFPLIS